VLDEDDILRQLDEIVFGDENAGREKKQKNA
jgi:hypothetical protein